MIIRLLGEGQFQLSGKDLDVLNEVDNQIVEALANSDQPRFASLMNQLCELVQHHGTRLPPEEIRESDLIIPHPESTMEEVREMFSEEGLIPG